MTDIATTTDTNPAQKRHWIYGLNVTMLVAIGLVVLGFALKIGEMTTSWGHWDWTSSGLYSLSSSSKAVLKDIADQKQTYTVLSLFPNPGQSAGESTAGSQTEKYRQVNDILAEYARANAAFKVEDAGDIPLEDVERRVRDLYGNELKNYQQAVEDFDPLAKKLSDFIKDEAAAIGAAGQKPGTPAEEVRAAASLQAEFSNAPQQFDTLQRYIRRETDQVLPRWNNLTDMIKTTMEDIVPTFQLLADPAKLKEAQFPNSLVAYFTSAQPKYKKMADDLAKYKERLDKLEPLKVQDVLTKLTKNTVVILGPTSAKVLGEGELYEYPQGQNDNPQPTFIGEQAISSAILSMVRPDKVKVVFVTTSPQHLTTDVFASASSILQAANFEVLEWSPPSPPMPGSPPPDNGPPAAQGKDAQGRPVIWIVFPPDAPDMRMMMQGMPPPNPQPVIDATRKHLEEGGQAMFLAEASSPNPMMGGMGSTDYPYADLIKDYGVDVQSKYTVVRAQEGEDESGNTVRQVAPVVFIERFEDHEITRPLQSFRTVFAAGRGQMGPMGVPTVVSVHKPLPKGAQAQVLANTAGGDSWAESNFTPDAKFDRESDLASPVPIIVAAIRNKGEKDKEQRIVVVGSKLFAADYFLTAAQPVLVGGRLRRIPMFPGNSELFRNSILWLAGYENMISVSSKAMQAARIKDIAPAQLALVRWGVLGGAPVAALVLGGIIYMMRRRT